MPITVGVPPIVPPQDQPASLDLFLPAHGRSIAPPETSHNASEERNTDGTASLSLFRSSFQWTRNRNSRNGKSVQASVRHTSLLPHSNAAFTSDHGSPPERAYAISCDGHSVGTEHADNGGILQFDYEGFSGSEQLFELLSR